jgi:class 3 adenylate cyclase/tetratricopeptide (TPR) repeat protein
MRTCPACGEENPEHARFCLACGTPLAERESPWHEERRVITVLFVDLVGFTARAEHLDPEDVRAILTPYHECVRREIESFGGIVEKFIGDAVMAVFGAPTAYGDDAERALRAAFAVRESVRQMNEDDPKLELHLRLAANTGDAIVSLDARPALGEAMVAGDVVNTASRLQQVAPLDGIVAGRETYAATRAAIEFEPMAAVEVKGKRDPVEAWIALRALTAAGERPISGTIIGRTRELNALRGIWDHVAAERTPHLVTVFGPAGVGKTRLGLEFARTVEELGGRAVRGRSLPYRESSAYGAFATHVKQFCRIFESDTVEVGLEKLRTTTADLFAAEEAAMVAGHLAILLGYDTARQVEDRETLFLSVRRFIEGVAKDRPTMLVFEDVHWADTGLLQLIEFLAAQLHDLPLLVLALARPELLDSRPGWGGGLLAYSAVRLGPLTDEEAAELARQRLPDLAEDAVHERLAALIETAGGNALFVEQLAATMAEAPPSTADVPLPTTVKGLVAARLDALPTTERRLLLDAAVGGKVFWRGALDTTDDDAELGALLGALERRDLIRREAVSSIENDEQYAFTHVLIRDVAYELLPRARRQQRHADLARFLERATAEVGEATAATARHWRDSGDQARAIDYFIAAAEQAERGWAKEQALALYREALKLVPAEEEAKRSLLRRRVALADQAVYHLADARLLRRSGPAAGSWPGRPSSPSVS